MTQEDPVGTLDAALAHAARLLDTRPVLAAEQAQEILKVVPGEPRAILLLARAKIRLDAVGEALPLLQSLGVAEPGVAIAQCELGLTLRALGRSGEAIASLRHAVALQPNLATAWLALAEIYTDVGDVRNADLAHGRHIQCATRDPRMRAAGAALYDNRLPEAESLLRAQIREQPADVAALRMLAEVAGASASLWGCRSAAAPLRVACAKLHRRPAESRAGVASSEQTGGGARRDRPLSVGPAGSRQPS